MMLDVSKASINTMLTDYLEHAKVYASDKLIEEVLTEFYDSGVKKIVRRVQKCMDSTAIT